MKKLTKIAMATALSVGLWAPACGGGDDDANSGSSNSGTSNSGTSNSGSSDSGSSNSGSITYTEVSFSPVYYTAYILDYGSYGQYLSLYIDSVKINSSSGPASFPYDELSLDVKLDGLKAQTITLPNDANAEDYAALYKGIDSNYQAEYGVVSDGGTVNITAISSDNLAGSIKNLTLRSITSKNDSYSYTSDKAVKIAEVDLTTNYISLVKCDDEDNLEEDEYCACWPEDCYGDGEDE